MRIAAGLLVAMHGLVHAMYVGQSLRWFELREGMAWPVGSRYLSSIPDATLRASAAIAVGVSALALVAGGVGIAMNAGWGATVTFVAAVVLSVLHFLLWDGDVKTFPDQGLYGVIINVCIVVWIAAIR